VLPNIRGALSLAGLLGPAVLRAVAIAGLLYWGASVWEKHAGHDQINFVAKLLIKGNLRKVGALVATVLPDTFDNIFGKRPVSGRFICRSVLATALFWISLLTIRNPRPGSWHLGTFESHFDFNFGFVLCMVFVDWISLIKARWLINVIITRNHTLLSALQFVCVDVAASYALTFIVPVALYFTLLLPMHGVSSDYILRMFVEWLWYFEPLRDYLFHRSENIHLLTVTVPTTLLTSAWTLLLLSGVS
jgi:hypothetical protein